MPSGKHQRNIDIPIENVWNFVSDMNNWAPLVPGYVEHKILNEKQSTWKFKGDLGIVKKTVKLKIDITEWNEPTTVRFKLTGLNENFKGDGYFEAEKLSETNTNMTGSLTINAKGLSGPLINSVLKSYVPKTATDFTDAVADKIIEVETVSNY
ncbi:CoxG family protein [Virgibacillus flavescens]|uniref:CoxG family protein n=1 Tax=Virgibacillus flavescens TaxID=1611422 RepID=UPI003D34D556